VDYVLIQTHSVHKREDEGLGGGGIVRS